MTCVGQNCPAQCITTQTCISSNGQLISNVCYLCSSGQVVVNGVCQNGCGANQVLTSTGCVCINGFVSVASICYQSCGTNSYFNNGICQCLPGYVATPTPNVCALSNGCGINYVLSNGVCICPSGFGLIGTQCLVCPTNSYVQGGYCTCFAGFVLQNNQCISQNSCNGGAVWNGVACVCPLGLYLNVQTQSCTSCNTPGQVISGSNCVCSNNYYPSAGSCLPCPNFSTFSSTTNTCVCISGYTLSNGQCIPNTNCPANSFFNTTSQTCQCLITGQYIINGNCQACPSGSSWNGVACICASGSYLFNSICYPCSSTCLTCNGPTNNQCLTCVAPGTFPVNGVCNSGSGCPSGNYLSQNGQCLPCFTNCVTCLTGTTCTQCASGYTLSINSVNNVLVQSCTVTPPPPPTPNYKISLKGRVVGNTVLYQGLAMSQMPTGILANGCDICNNLLLINTVSSFSNVVATTEYILDSQYWFLTTFTFPSATFIPDFQFTVQINPIYANYFTSADLTQKISVTITQAALNSPDVTNLYNSGPVSQTGQGVVTRTIPGSNKAGLASAVVAKIFSPTAKSS